MNNDSGQTTGAVRAWLRLEAAAVLAIAVYAFHVTSGRWGLFVLLFLVPDLSMLGYLAGKRTGSVIYNLAHNYLGPAILAGAGVALAEPLPVTLTFVWTAHIAFDRVLGYGLKYPDGFGHTHLGRIGRIRTAG